MSLWLGGRARSARAADRVTAGLVDARALLEWGRVRDARVTLARVLGDLKQVDDAAAWRKLSWLSANLLKTTEATPDGQRVRTDERGLPSSPG